MTLPLQPLAQSLWHALQTRLLRLLVTLRLPRHAPPTGRLLVIAPHPDDEILGAGGMLLSALERQQRVDILYLTDGEGAGTHPDPARIRAERLRIADHLMGELNIPADRIQRWHLADGGVPRQGAAGFEALAVRLAALIDTLQPDWVLATHAWDYWPYDHVACAELAKAAVARSRHRPRLGFYWVWAWYNLRPWRLRLTRHPGLRRIDITPWADKKRYLVSQYFVPKGTSGLPWSGKLPISLWQACRAEVEVIPVLFEKSVYFTSVTCG